MEGGWICVSIPRECGPGESGNGAGVPGVGNPGYLPGNPEEIVHLDGSGEWRSPGGRQMHSLLILAFVAGSGVPPELPARHLLPAAGADTVQPHPPRPPSRLYAGMWSVHLRDLEPTPTANHLLALAHEGFFVGTFVNSFHDRGMAAGLQREFTRWEWDQAVTSVGWRGGMVTGYDERLLGGLGDQSPLVPFLQVLWNVDWRRVGVEFSWSGIVVSAATNVRLGG